MKGDKDVRRLEREIARIKKAEEKERRRKKDEKRDRKTGRGAEPEHDKKRVEASEQTVISKSAMKKLEKKELIAKRLKEYTTPIKISKDETYTPQEKDVEDFRNILDGLKPSQLKLMGRIIDVPLKLDFMDRMKSYNKKEHAVVTIYNDNKTTDTGVIHCYDRTFSRHDMTYMVMSERGIYDPEFKMMHFYYFANQPCPIVFQKGRLPENTYDSRLIDDTIQMKVIEALAAVDIERFIKITLVCIILNLLMSAVTVLILANMNGLIPKGGG